MKHPLIASIFTLIITLTPMLASAQSRYRKDVDNLSISEILEIPSYKLSWENKIEHLAEHPEMDPEAAEELLEYATSDRNYFFDSNERSTLAEFAVTSGATNLGLLNQQYDRFWQNAGPKIVEAGIASGINAELDEAAFDYALTAYINQEGALQILSKLSESGFDTGIATTRFLSEKGINAIHYNRRTSTLLFILEQTKNEKLITKLLNDRCKRSFYGNEEREQDALLEASLAHIQDVKHSHVDTLLNADRYNLSDETRIRSITQLLETSNDPSMSTYTLHKALELSETSYDATLWLQVAQKALNAGADPHQASPAGINLITFLKKSLNSYTLELTLQIASMLTERGVNLQEINLFSITKALLDHHRYHSSETLSRETINAIHTLTEYQLKRGDMCEQEYTGKRGEMPENGLGYYLNHLELILQKKHKYLDAPKSSEARIPQIMHHIWLTNPEKPREMRNEDIEQVIHTKEIFAQSKGTWEHIIWVNDRNLIPESVKVLEAEEISVKSIKAHAEALSNYNYVIEFIREEKWGAASDTLRYSLVELFGGVYTDLNFVFERNLNDEIYRYDFFTEDWKPDDLYINNFFFAAKPQHPIMKRMTELVARNVGPNPPQYIKEVIENEIKSDGPPVGFTSFATANPTYIAYIQKAHEEGTIDAIYPYHLSNIDDMENVYDSSFYQNTGGDDINTLKDSFPELANACSEFSKVNDPCGHIRRNNLCPAEELYFGHEGDNGGTWMEFGNE